MKLNAARLIEIADELEDQGYVVYAAEIRGATDRLQRAIRLSLPIVESAARQEAARKSLDVTARHALKAIKELL
jgi:hypothetical protein